MMRKALSSRRQDTPPARIAWLSLLAVPLVAVLVLCATGAGSALGDAEAPTPEPGAQLSEGDEWEAECFEEAEELEADAEEAEELCEEGDESEAGDSCPLRSAHAHAAAIHDKLKITIGYTTTEPTAAKIQISNGHAGIKSFKRHLGRSGVLRFTEKLPQTQSTKVVVSMEPVGHAGCPSRRLVLSLPS